MPMYLCLPCVKGGGGVAAGGIVTKVRNNPSGAPAPAPLAQGSRISHNSVGRGLAPAAFVRELLFLPPSVREVSPNGDGRSFEQSKNSPSHLSVTAPSPRGLKKSADFTLAAKKNRPNGNPFGLRFFLQPLNMRCPGQSSRWQPSQSLRCLHRQRGCPSCRTFRRHHRSCGRCRS